MGILEESFRTLRLDPLRRDLIFNIQKILRSHNPLCPALTCPMPSLDHSRCSGNIVSAIIIIPFAENFLINLSPPIITVPNLEKRKLRILEVSRQ